VLLVSVVNEHHHAFINSKMHLCLLLDCVLQDDPPLLVLSRTRFNVELQYLYIWKSLLKLIKCILKLLLLAKIYPICKVKSKVVPVLN
jgi:hypothetical protein